MHEEFFRKIGLSEGEIKVYEALLQSGPSGLGKIHEAIGIERRNIYDILNKLIEKGLISYIEEKGKRTYQCTHPNKIMSYLDEKEQDVVRTKDELQQQMSALLEQFSTAKPAINAEIYRGVEGMKAAWDDILNYDAIYWIGAGRYMPKAHPHYFTSWNRKRLEKKMKIFNILRHELKKEIMKPYALEQMRFLPSEFSGSPTVIGIYGDKVGNFLFGEELFVFVIESKELAENYKRYHKYLWENIAKP